MCKTLSYRVYFNQPSKKWLGDHILCDNLHGWACDRSHFPIRVHVPLIDLGFDTSQSVGGNIFFYVDDPIIYNGPSSLVVGTPPIILNLMVEVSSDT